jgi:hypothetical protein
MDDEAWVAELRARAAPLRVELPPWGEVLWRGAIREPASRASRPRRWVWAPLAAAAGLLLTCLFLGRADVVVPAEPLDAPAVSRELAEPAAAPVIPRQGLASTPLPATPLPAVLPPGVDAPASPSAPDDAKASRRARPRRDGRPAVQTPRPAPAPSAVTVDCGLDPSRCEAPSPVPPESLTTIDIVRAMSTLKAELRRCGATHGVPENRRVELKLRIGGADGRAIEVSVDSPGVALPLAECLREVTRRAEFPRFRRPTLSVIYPVNL